MTHFPLALPLLALLSGPLAAAEAPDARRYADCLDLARQRPADGWEAALAWQSLGGGEAARHCGAVALIGLEQYGEAATRLEALAGSSHAEPRLRAGMLAQAAQGWLLEGRLERAVAAQTVALGLTPDDPDLLVDRAMALAEAANYGEARSDLDRALAIAPDRPDALTLRASAHRYLDDAAAARRDVDRALALDPRFADAYVERGILRRLDGDVAGARRDWLAALGVAAPESAAAESARRNIEKIDVKAGR